MEVIAAVILALVIEHMGVKIIRAINRQTAVIEMAGTREDRLIHLEEKVRKLRAANVDLLDRLRAARPPGYHTRAR